MKHYFICSLCYKGILGGGLTLDEKTICYKTGKLTVDSRFRNLEIPREEILSLSWKRAIFPVAVFTLKNGEVYRFLIFNKRRFMRAYEA